MTARYWLDSEYSTPGHPFEVR